MLDFHFYYPRLYITHQRSEVRSATSISSIQFKLALSSLTGGPERSLQRVDHLPISIAGNLQLHSMASRVIAYGVPSALALGGALTASSLFASSQNDESRHNRTSVNGTLSQGSAFDFNATFLGQTLSYKKNQVVATVKEVGKEVGKELKQAGAKVVEGSK